MRSVAAGKQLIEKRKRIMHKLTDAEYQKLVQATLALSRAHRHIGMGNEHSKDLVMDAIEMLDDILWRLGLDEEKFEDE